MFSLKQTIHTNQSAITIQFERSVKDSGKNNSELCIAQYSWLDLDDIGLITLPLKEPCLCEMHLSCHSHRQINWAASDKIATHKLLQWSLMGRTAPESTEGLQAVMRGFQSVHLVLAWMQLLAIDIHLIHQCTDSGGPEHLCWIVPSGHWNQS